MLAIILGVLLIISLIIFATGLKEDAESDYSARPKTIFEWKKGK